MVNPNNISSDLSKIINRLYAVVTAMKHDPEQHAVDVKALHDVTKDIWKDLIKLKEDKLIQPVPVFTPHYPKAIITPIGDV